MLRFTNLSISIPIGSLKAFLAPRLWPLMPGCSRTWCCAQLSLPFSVLLRLPCSCVYGSAISEGGTTHQSMWLKFSVPYLILLVLHLPHQPAMPLQTAGHVGGMFHQTHTCQQRLLQCFGAEGCPMRPAFGKTGKGATFCNAHKLGGMVDVPAAAALTTQAGTVCAVVAGPRRPCSPPCALCSTPPPRLGC